MFLLERFIAWRYLRTRRQEGFISVIAGFSFLGIFLGVATLIVVTSVMNGFRSELLGRILGVNGHISVYSTTGSLLDYDTLDQQIHTIPGVRAAYPLVDRQAMILADGTARGALVHGLTAQALAERPIVHQKIVAGTPQFDRPDAALLGYKLAEKLNVRVGDRVTLMAPEGTPSALGTIPRMKRFYVTALFDVGMNEYDNTFVFIPLLTAQKFFRTFPGVSGFEIFMDDPENIAAPTRVLQSMIRSKPGLRVFDWQQANASFFSVIEVERNVMFLILTLIVLVAAFNVISSLIMLVKDKTSDIAILRTMGASQGLIRRIFMLTGASIGVSGTLLGTALGLWICYHIEQVRQLMENLTGATLFPAEFYFLSKLPAKVELSEVGGIVLMTLILTFIATLYPSWRAARLNPIEALRYA